VLYTDDGLGRRSYLAWLRSLGVRYVVLPDAALDYSARAEARLIRSGRSGLEPVMRSAHLTIFEVPSPRPLVTGPAAARVIAFTESRVSVAVAEAGTYRLAIRYSPYWSASSGCLDRSADGMISLTVPVRGSVDLRFHVNARRALYAFAGESPQACSG
jgi:hypothetical protein